MDQVLNRVSSSIDLASVHVVPAHGNDKVAVLESNPSNVASEPTPVVYRLYKRRFQGLIGFVLLNIVTAMGCPWFGPISNNMVEEFSITLDEVNWLGNIVACVYLPVALIIPWIVSRYGVRRCCDIGAAALLIAAWVRYAGTARSLSSKQSYALLILGQLFVSIAQPIYQVLGPTYSETWFNLDARTTATMVIAISNPVGGAIGQLMSPLVGDTRHSILVLAIISTAVIPFVFFIGDAPPTPPTYAASQKAPSLLSLVKAMLGLPTSQNQYMSIRERIDFAIVTLIFGVLIAVTNAFTLLSAQDLQPYGYSSDISGLMGACLLLTGIVSAGITAPLFDRVFTHHLAMTAKILVPIIGCTWLSLIWAAKPHNTGGLFAIMSILGICLITMLPVGLELGCDLTKNTDASSALLWFIGNLFSVTFVLSEGALRAGPEAEPPLNMHRALIFNGVTVFVVSSTVFLLRGKQSRKVLDEEKLQQSLQLQMARGKP